MLAALAAAPSASILSPTTRQRFGSTSRAEAANRSRPSGMSAKVHTVITDKATPRSQVAMLQKHGVEVLVAKC